MEALLTKIKDAQSEITKQQAIKNDKYEFLKTFFENNSLDTFESISQIDRVELATAMIAVTNDSMPIEDIYNTLQQTKTFLKNISDDEFMKLCDYILKILSFDSLDKILHNLDNGTRYNKLQCALSSNYSNTECMISFANALGCSPKELSTLIKFIRDEVESVEDKNCRDQSSIPRCRAINYIALLNDAVKTQKSNSRKLVDTAVEAFLSTLAIKEFKFSDEGESTALNMANEAIGRDYFQAFSPELDPLRIYYANLVNREENKQHKLDRLQRNYSMLESDMLDAARHTERIVKAPEELSTIPDVNIRRNVLRIIYNHNKPLYDAKQKEYEEMMSDSLNAYLSLFATYGIFPSQNDIEAIAHHSLEDVDSMIQQLTKGNITDPALTLNIIKISDPEIIEAYNSLTARGIITKGLLTNNLNLFDHSSPECQNLMKNIQTIENDKINPYYFTTSEKVLTTPHQTFQDNMKTLKDYKLMSSQKTGMDVSFLNASDLTEAIDTLLELGYEKNLEEKIELLNQRDKFERLRMLKELNVPVSSTDELTDVLTTPKFYMPESLIPDYIYNAALYNLPEDINLCDTPTDNTSTLNRLANFSKSERTYDIGGVTISKNRVKRNLSTIAQDEDSNSSLTYSILKGATLNDEEVASIKTSIASSKATQFAKK